MNGPDTLGYYSSNAKAYADATADVPMEDLYSAFLDLIRPGGKILDVGCGGGRDLEAFLKRGFRAEGLEPCAELARAAEERSGALVRIEEAQDLEEVSPYDAIWACASLLHVPRSEQPSTIAKLIKAVKPEGVIYMSFKHGYSDRIAEDGRLFSDHTCQTLGTLVAGFPNVEVISVWSSTDKLTGRQDLTWTNIILRRVR